MIRRPPRSTLFPTRRSSDLTVGGAQVSEKHSGFVINKGNATAADVMELIRQVTAKVKEDTGVTMEPEVKQIGEF